MRQCGVVSAQVGVSHHQERDQWGVQARINRAQRMRGDEEYRLEQLRKAAIRGGMNGRGRKKVPVTLPYLKCLESED
jgi:hypothetical protein